MLPALYVSGKIITASNHGEAFSKLDPNEKSTPIIDGFYDEKKQKFFCEDKVFYLKQIVLLRHAEFQNNEITQEGQHQAFTVGNFLKKEFPNFLLQHSPVLRCQETAKILANIIGNDHQVEPKAAKQDDLEDDNSFTTRINELLDSLPKKTILVCHSDVIQKILTIFGFNEEVVVPTCSITFFDKQRIVWISKECKDLPLEKVSAIY